MIGTPPVVLDKLCVPEIENRLCYLEDKQTRRLGIEQSCLTCGRHVVALVAGIGGEQHLESARASFCAPGERLTDVPVTVQSAVS